ncbi:MAG: OadG family protein [Parasporobacterium sp.]|nr:OadG family protein [Parasporobacterium sp.]
MDYSNLFVCLMGICTVFIGLICIIVLVTIMSGIIRKTDRTGKKETAAAAAPSQQAVPANAGAGTITPQLAAAVSAVIAEEMGTDAAGIRIVSFKKVNA